MPETTMPAAHAAAGPVPASERFESLDLLRGVAVLGILVMNIYAFAMPFPAYVDPTVMGGNEPWNLGTWVVTHILFDQKFLTIFSMLFGAGIVLMMDRADAKGVPFGPMFFRRQFWLLVIALLHAYLVWFGDILFYYAVIGMLAYLFRKASPLTLIVVALFALQIPLLLTSVSADYMEQLMAEVAEIDVALAEGDEPTAEQQAKLDEWEQNRTFFAPTDEDVLADLEAYRGSYAAILEHRTPHVWMMHLTATPFFMLWRIGGLMLIGMALMKLGVLTGQRSNAFYRNLMLAGYGLGLPLTIYSAWAYFANDFEPLWSMRQGGVPNAWGSILVALGHVALVMLIARSGAFHSLALRFEAVGRMAFTNYLMHSLVMTTIFYGYGLGLYGEVPRLYQMLFVAGMLAFQLVLSPWWLKRFRFGPAEWLWRSLTYGQRQPFRVR